MNDCSITISRHAKIRKAFKRLATVLHSDEKEGASSSRRVSQARREVTRHDHNHYCPSATFRFRQPRWRDAETRPHKALKTKLFASARVLLQTSAGSHHDRIAFPTLGGRGTRPRFPKYRGISIRFWAANACAHTRTGLDIACGLPLLVEWI